MANFKAATDLDLLESQGFDREASKRALRATHGDPIEAKKILDDLVLAEEFPEFLTLPAYAIQDKPSSRM